MKKKPLKESIVREEMTMLFKLTKNTSIVNTLGFKTRRNEQGVEYKIRQWKRNINTGIISTKKIRLKDGELQMPPPPQLMI